MAASKKRKTKGPNAKRRAKGSGTFVERKDGRWAYVIELEPEGDQRRRRTIYARSENELRQKVADETARQGGAIKRREPGTLAAFLTSWLEDGRPNWAPTTAALYDQLLTKHVIPFVGGAKDRIDTFDTESAKRLYADMRRRGVTESVLNSCARILRSAFATRMREQGKPNPFAMVKLPKYTPDEVRPLSVDGVRAFLAAARKSPIESLFVLAVMAGLRFGEALALKWDDIDEQNGMIYVRRALKDVKGTVSIENVKTKRSLRRVPLARQALEALERRRTRAKAEGHGSAFIHVGPTGAHLRPSYVRRRYLAPILEGAGIEHATVHGLRHAFSTMMQHSGATARTTGDTMGHSKASVTIDVYSHTDQAAQREAIDRLSAFVARKPKSKSARTT